MRIGIPTDTHDDAAATSRALPACSTAGCSPIVHGGDAGSPFTARLIKNSFPAHPAVSGNSDGDRIHRSLVLDIKPAPRSAEVEGTRIIIFPIQKGGYH